MKKPLQTQRLFLSRAPQAAAGGYAVTPLAVSAYSSIWSKFRYL
jgi:hypothetical protein